MAARVQRAVAMSTPPRNAKPRSVYSEQEKRSLLDNYDLEVEDKTRAFNSALAATLSSFMLRQEAEILKIPRDLRSMTLGQLEAQWGGSWAGTVQRIARDKMEEREREEAAQRERARAEEDAKGKRKRAEDASADEASSSSRTSKNARKDAVGPSQKIPMSAGKRRLTAKTPRSQPATSGASKGPSGLPQDHIFNPLLPATPGFARRPRRNESFFSANGSPIVIPGAAPDSPSLPLADGAGAEKQAESDDDDDLPDPEAMEAKLLAQRPTSPASKPSRRPKRAPSLFFRQSIAPNDPVAPNAARGEEPLEPELASIPLSDGRTVTFNPLDLSPGRIDAEMEQGGLGENEKVRVKSKVKDAVFQALTAKMEKWKVLG